MKDPQRSAGVTFKVRIWIVVLGFALAPVLLLFVFRSGPNIHGRALSGNVSEAEVLQLLSSTDEHDLDAAVAYLALHQRQTVSPEVAAAMTDALMSDSVFASLYGSAYLHCVKRNQRVFGDVITSAIQQRYESLGASEPRLLTEKERLLVLGLYVARSPRWDTVDDVRARHSFGTVNAQDVIKRLLSE